MCKALQKIGGRNGFSSVVRAYCSLRDCKRVGLKKGCL